MIFCENFNCRYWTNDAVGNGQCQLIGIILDGDGKCKNKRPVDEQYVKDIKMGTNTDYQSSPMLMTFNQNRKEVRNR